MTDDVDNVDDVDDKISSKNRFLQFVADFKGTFSNLISTVNEINDAFNEISNFITENIDTLLGAPLQLATACQRLIAAPARISQSVESRVNGYLQGYNNLLSDPQGDGTVDIKNQRVEKQLLLTGHLSGISEVYLFPDTDGIGFLTKDDAIESALNLASLYGEMQDFLDTQQANSLNDSLSNRFVVGDAVTQGIKNITSQTARDLLRLSFSLKQERILILDKWYNILDLCFKLYGTTDNDTLDFFIESNGLTGQTILQVPKGRSVVYYV